MRSITAAVRRIATQTRRVRRNVDPDRFTTQDLVVEAMRGLSSKPSRLLMTTLGTTIGIASLVVTIGFAQTSARQLSRQFDAVVATHAVIEPARVSGSDGLMRSAASLPWDSVDRVSGLSGIERVGLLSDIPLQADSISTLTIDDPSAPARYSPPLIAATPLLVDTLGGAIVTGRMFDGGHDRRSDRVVVLGADAAERLGITRVNTQPSIFISGIPFAVIGIVDGFEIRTDLLGGAIIPMNTARTTFGLEAPTELHVELALGAGQVVERQVPIALDPNQPDSFDVAAPPPPSELRKSVAADIDLVFVILGVLALLAGGLGIANVTLLAVSERGGEIGLRRALGASDTDIRGQFMLESSITGLLGGLIGAAVGMGSIVVVSALQGWTPVLDAGLAAICALLGGLVGLAAGLYPAIRASRIEPAAALRSGT